MHDRPNANELIAAVREFLESELLPSIADARLRFQTLIAANVLAIAERELTDDDGASANARQAAVAANALLCERIRKGEFDAEPRFTAMLRKLRQSVEHKLEVANPRYLAAFRPTKETT